MTESNDKSLEHFEVQLRKMATPSSIERSEELFYQLGWEAAIANQTNIEQTNSTAIKPFITGIAFGVAATLALFFNIWRPSIEPGRDASMVVNETSLKNSITKNAQKIAKNPKVRSFDDSEFLIALAPPYASHGVQLDTRGNTNPRSFDDMTHVPRSQSTQSFRQEVLKEIR